MEPKSKKANNQKSLNNQKNLKKRNVVNYCIMSILAVTALILFTGLFLAPLFEAIINAVFAHWSSKIEIAILLLAILFILILYLWVRALIYIHRDSKSRNMSPLLWVSICVFFPYLLGFLVYFLVRDSLPLKCPNCRVIVSKGDKFCQQCGFKLSDTCKKCGGSLPGEAKFCPNCGTTLAA